MRFKEINPENKTNLKDSHWVISWELRSINIDTLKDLKQIIDTQVAVIRKFMR